MLARLKHLQDLHATLAVGAWRLPRADALQEVFALATQRLFPGKRHNLPVVAASNRHSIQPVDAVRVEGQLALWLDIVEDGHFLASHNRQLLLFEGMEPADENVRFDAATEVAGGQRGIEDVRIKIAAAVRRYADRRLVQKVENRRDVVRCETPQNVF